MCSPTFWLPPYLGVAAAHRLRMSGSTPRCSQGCGCQISSSADGSYATGGGWSCEVCGKAGAEERWHCALHEEDFCCECCDDDTRSVADLPSVQTPTDADPHSGRPQRKRTATSRLSLDHAAASKWCEPVQMNSIRHRGLEAPGTSSGVKRVKLPPETGEPPPPSTDAPQARGQQQAGPKTAQLPTPDRAANAPPGPAAATTDELLPQWVCPMCSREMLSVLCVLHHIRHGPPRSRRGLSAAAGRLFAENCAGLPAGRRLPAGGSARTSVHAARRAVWLTT